MSGRGATQSSFRRPAFAVERVIGASHLRSGKPCQDHAGSWTVADAVVVAVADGHGTSKHADAGAQLAVHGALSARARFAEELGDRSARLPEVQKYAEHPLRVQVVREWASRVRAKAGDEQAPLLDYGSTLIFALSTPHFLLFGQLGDGAVLLVDCKGSVEVPLPADPSAVADETPSLCLPEAWHSMRVRALPAPSGEALLLLSTDGYSKSYATDADFQQTGPDYLDIVRQEGVSGLTPHLRGFLEQVTTRGSGDDIALALLHWPPVDQATDAEPEIVAEEPDSSGVTPPDTATPDEMEASSDAPQPPTDVNDAEEVPDATTAQDQ